MSLIAVLLLLPVLLLFIFLLCVEFGLNKPAPAQTPQQLTCSRVHCRPSKQAGRGAGTR